MLKARRRLHRDRGDDRLDLHRHLGAFAIDAGAQVEHDADRKILDAFADRRSCRRCFRYGNLPAHLNPRLAVVENQHRGTRQHLGVTGLLQRFELATEVNEIAKAVARKQKFRKAIARSSGLEGQFGIFLLTS